MIARLAYALAVGGTVSALVLGAIYVELAHIYNVPLW